MHLLDYLEVLLSLFLILSIHNHLNDSMMSTYNRHLHQMLFDCSAFAFVVVVVVAASAVVDIVLEVK